MVYGVKRKHPAANLVADRGLRYDQKVSPDVPLVSCPVCSMSSLLQHFGVRLVVVFVAVAVLIPGATAAQSALAPPNRVVGDDTAIVHRQLRKSIEKFQNAWRSAWLKEEHNRHQDVNLTEIRGYAVRSDGLIEDPVWFGDRAGGNMTTDLRRYLAVLCNIDSPTDRQIEYIKSGKRLNIGSPSIFKAPSIESVNQIGIVTKNVTGMEGQVNSVTSRLIQAKPNFGGVCPSWTPPEERVRPDEGEAIDLALSPKGRESLRRQREVLIYELALAQAKYPGDAWIAGQHLRFVIDQRDPARSVELAAECRAAVEWCARLMGLAQQQADNIPGAEYAFRLADSLAMLQRSAQECVEPETWVPLPREYRDDAERGTCAQQRAFVERMWWLSDPMWSVPGNERFVEHEARRISGTLRAVMDRDERYIWEKSGGGEALREMLIRYGWPSYTYHPGFKLEVEMSKVREEKARYVMPPYTAKEYSPDRTALIPSMKGINSPFKIRDSDYELSLQAGRDADGWWPTEHMMLQKKLKTLASGQQVQWRRDSVVLFGLVVDHAIDGLDTAVVGASAAMLVGSSAPSDLRPLARARIHQDETLRMFAPVPSAPIVLSAEVQARSIREPARRLRFGLTPVPTLRDMQPDDVAVSDPVFIRMPTRGATMTNTIAAVEPVMAGALEFARSTPLALFWESYGFSPDDSTSFELRVNRADDVNLARRVGSALGLVSALRDSVSIKWSEPDARNGASVVTATSKTIIGRSVALDLSALPAGTYVVSIEMRSGARMAHGERRFVLVR